MRCLAVLFCITTTVARAQQPTPPPAESARAESVPAPPPPPTLDQKRFLDGLRTATRGIAQLKDGLKREPAARRSVPRRGVRQRPRVHGARAAVPEASGLRGLEPREGSAAHFPDGFVDRLHAGV